jgi:hypothetical protein
MTGWISEAAVIRLLMVFVLFSAVINRSRKPKLQWIVNISVVAVTLTLYAVSSGHHGVLIGLAGTASALVLCIPLHRFGWMKRIDIGTTCVIGMHVGPAGLMYAYGIALGLALVQHCLKARTTSLIEYGGARSPFYPPVIFRGIMGPSLVEIESQRMIEDEQTERIAHGWYYYRQGTSNYKFFIPTREEVLPWSGKIALATLAVCMFGIPG